MNKDKEMANCRFNKQHKIPRSQLLEHEKNCPNRNSNAFICPYNPLHLLPNELVFKKHITRNCPNRPKIEKKNEEKNDEKEENDNQTKKDIKEYIKNTNKINCNNNLDAINGNKITNTITINNDITWNNVNEKEYNNIQINNKWNNDDFSFENLEQFIKLNIKKLPELQSNLDDDDLIFKQAYCA